MDWVRKMEIKKEVLKGSHKEEIQKYFQDLEFYDLEHYDRRHEQIQRVKNRTPEEKKARKERKEEHKRTVEMC